MEAVIGVYLALVSCLIACTEGSSLLFAIRDVYSELNAQGHVSVGRHGNPLELSSVSNDPLGILVKLLDARFLDADGNILHSTHIGEIPDPFEYYYYGEEEEEDEGESKVLFHLFPYELEEYQNKAALGRKMTAVYPEAGLQLTLSVYIFMKTGVLDLGTDLEHTVHRGHVRVDLEFSRTAGAAASCRVCGQVATVELDMWIRGEGPISKDGNRYYTRYDMGGESQLTIPHQAMGKDNIQDVDAESSGEGNAVNLTLRSGLPSDDSPVLYSLTIRPADIPPPSRRQEEDEDYYDNYMDQEPEGEDTDTDMSEDDSDRTQEVKDAQQSSAATTLPAQLACAICSFVTFISARRLVFL